MFSGLQVFLVLGAGFMNTIGQSEGCPILGELIKSAHQ